jgi:hypothetical protein
MKEGGEEAAVVLVGEGADGVCAVGAVAQLVGDCADIGAEGGEFGGVLVPGAFGYSQRTIARLQEAPEDGETRGLLRLLHTRCKGWFVSKRKPHYVRVVVSY